MSAQGRARVRGPSLLRAQKGAGTLAAAFAVLACATSGELGTGLVALLSASLVASALRGDGRRRFPAWAWTALLALCLLYLALQVARGATDVVAGAARFCALLCVHRLWNRQSERDELFLLLITLLLLCAGAALSADLTFGLCFAGYAVAATWSIALTHLRFRLEEGRGAEEAAALLRSRRVTSPALLGSLAGLALAGLAGSAALFLVFPRVTLRGLHRAVAPRAQPGLGDQVDLRGHGIIDDDPRVVLRVRLDPDPGREELGMHFRARALEQWTGRGWRTARDARQPVFGPIPLPAPLRSQQRRRLEADMVALAGFSDGIILAPPGAPVRVSFERPLAARGAVQTVSRDGAGDLFYAPPEAGLRYRVIVEELVPGAARSGWAGLSWPPEDLAVDLDVPPELSPRARALAERLTRGKDPAAAAAAVEAYLSSSFTYTRELPGLGADPIEDFLFVHRRGHCELFSSAMVLLLRAAGIPARNVTGYYGGVRNPGGYYAVRAGEAHSWVEVFLPGLGFVPYDPTPPQRRGGRIAGPWASAVLLWDALSARWHWTVVDFDLRAQARLAQRAAVLLAQVKDRFSARSSSGSPARPLGRLLLLLLAAALLALRLRPRRAGGKAYRATSLSADQRRARSLWRKARLHLVRCGLALRATATPAEALAALPGAAGEPARALRSLGERCLAARWGGAPLPASLARRLLRDLRGSLAG